ncbi:MAG: hypothetical protein JJE39_05005 [Vicinamibacteria bacterium]|nr:hypothetical protein [Vicinamibacteria bacterium]
MKVRRAFVVLFVGTALGCVKVQPPSDTGGLSPTATASSVTGPSSPTTPQPTPTPGDSTGTVTATAIGYTPDMQPVFASDCLVCHSDRNPLGRYSMSSYAAVLRAVSPGSASSTLVRVTQPNGSMFRYWSGNRQAKATLTRDWVVTNRAAQTR